MCLCVLRNEEYYIPLSKALILEERAEQIEKFGEESLNLDEEERNYRGELLTGEKKVHVLVQ